MSKKKTKQRPSTFIEYTLDMYMHQWEDATKRLLWQLMQGGGLYNIHVKDTLRECLSLYDRIAVHKDAIRSLKIALGEERV